MNSKGLDAIYKAISKSKIKEVLIKSNKGTEVRIVRSSEDIAKNLRKPIYEKSLAAEDKHIVKVEKDDNRFDIISPEVGFFNRYNTKTRQQFCKLRDVVEKGDIVATVVSLNIHHNILADQRGKIVEFLVEQDQPVAFGQPLIRLEKVEEDLSL